MWARISLAVLSASTPSANSGRKSTGCSSCSVNADHPFFLQDAAEFEQAQPQTAAYGWRRHSKELPDFLAGEPVEVHELDGTALFARKRLEGPSHLVPEDLPLCLLIRAIRRRAFQGIVEGGQFGRPPAPSPELVNAQVTRDRKYPAPHARFHRIILGRTPPNADKRLLHRLLRVTLGGEHAQGEGEALAVEAIIEGCEGGLPPDRNGCDEIRVLGEAVIAHVSSCTRYGRNAITLGAQVAVDLRVAGAGDESPCLENGATRRGRLPLSTVVERGSGARGHGPKHPMSSLFASLHAGARDIITPLSANHLSRYDARPMTMIASLPGTAAVERWLRACPGFEGAAVRSLEAAEGGASNITCRVALTSAPYAAIALRMQRDRGIFEPYDVIREGELIRRLGNTDLPVPRFIAGESDRGVLGAPFISLEWIDAPHMGNAGPEADFGAFTRAVAAVHAVDWRAAGLDFLGVPASAADGVQGEIEAVAARMPGFGCADNPLLSRAVDVLRATGPGDGRLALCQGDINVFNYLFRKGEVVGIVDWEQGRISDPRSDVGQLVALSHLKGAPWGPPEDVPFVQMYGAAAGELTAGMAYFRALWLWQLGVIYHGWMSFNDSEPWYSWLQIEDLLGRALDDIG